MDLEVDCNWIPMKSGITFTEKSGITFTEKTLNRKNFIYCAVYVLNTLFLFQRNWSTYLVFLVIAFSHTLRKKMKFSIKNFSSKCDFTEEVLHIY